MDSQKMKEIRKEVSEKCMLGLLGLTHTPGRMERSGGRSLALYSLIL